MIGYVCKLNLILVSTTDRRKCIKIGHKIDNSFMGTKLIKGSHLATPLYEPHAGMKGGGGHSIILS